MAELTTIARPYAEAAFALARDQNALPVWSQMLKLASRIVVDERVAHALDNPKLDTGAKESLLLSICGAANSVAVGIEVPHGPVVDTLIDRGFVLHAINPKQLDRLRDRHSVAGAKDDRRDAYVLGDGVRTDRRLFRRLHVADPRLVELRAWSRLAEEPRAS